VGGCGWVCGWVCLSRAGERPGGESLSLVRERVCVRVHMTVCGRAYVEGCVCVCVCVCHSV